MTDHFAIIAFALFKKYFVQKCGQYSITLSHWEINWTGIYWAPAVCQALWEGLGAAQ